MTANADIKAINYIMIFEDVLITLFIVFAAISMYAVNQIIKRQSEEIKIQKDKEITEIYRAEIGKIYDNILDFKHDYMKLYTSMSILLMNNDIDKLKEYFSSEITPLQNAVFDNNANNYALSFIEDDIIQGILYSYIIRSQNENIKFSIYISEKIPKHRTISSADLSRILAIVLDNAFEAAADSKEHAVILKAFTEDNKTKYTIKNTFKKAPDIPSLLSAASLDSRKGEHGRGLSIALKLCNKYNDVFLNATLKSGWFTYDLIL